MERIATMDAASTNRFGVAIAYLGYVAVVAGTVLAVPASSEAGFTGIYATDLLLGASFTTIGVLVSRRRSENPIGWLFLTIGVIEAATAALNHYAIVGQAAALPGAVWAGMARRTGLSPSSSRPGSSSCCSSSSRTDARPPGRGHWLAVGGARVLRAFALSEILLLPRMEVTTEIVTDNPTNVGSSAVPDSAYPRPGVPRRWGRRTRHPVPPRRWGGTPAAPLVRVRRGRQHRIARRTHGLLLRDRSTGARTRVVRRGIDGDDAHRHRCRRARRVRDRRAPVPTVGPRPRDPQNGRRRARHGAHQRDVRGDRGRDRRAGRLTPRHGFGLHGRRHPRGRVSADPSTGRPLRGPPRLRQASDPLRGALRLLGAGGGAYADDDVLPRMAEILGEGTGADAATVWLHVGRELRPAASWPADRELDTLAIHGTTVPGLGEPTFEVQHRGELLGALSMSLPANDPMDPTKERLVRDLASQAGLVLRNVRLIEELRASRQRLVAAQDEERRKIERNLHDGAQQQLVALQVQLRLMEQQVGKNTDMELHLVHGLQQAADAALDDLRDLARGSTLPCSPIGARGGTRGAGPPVTHPGHGGCRWHRSLSA